MDLRRLESRADLAPLNKKGALLLEAPLSRGTESETSDAFDQGGYGFAAADAQGRQARLGVLLGHRPEQGCKDACP